MFECPNCHEMLPIEAHFCTHCGARMATTALTAPTMQEDGVRLEDMPDNAGQLPAHTRIAAMQERDLAAWGTDVAVAVEELLPFVNEEHRAENRVLFAQAASGQYTIEDPIWGRASFVLGAYGNYMYRYVLVSAQRQLAWLALFWAIFYERSYRPKYFNQRFQQLLHFFQGCSSDPVFLVMALADLAELQDYLEANGLKRLLDALRSLQDPPADLIQQVEAHLQMKVDEAKRLKEMDTGDPIKPDNVAKEEPPSRPPLLRVEPRGRGGALSGGQQGHVSGDEPRGAEMEGPERALSFFTQSQQQEFFACLRLTRLKTIHLMLQEVRRPLLCTLLESLSLPALQHYREPRRFIRLGKKHADRFSEAHRLLQSPLASEQQAALGMFEQGVRETSHPDYRYLAQEWALYARAVTQGAHHVIDDWERNLQRNDASWEEIWNLAIFYQKTGALSEALRVLGRGLTTWNAPVAHLRLALQCALRLLLEPDMASASEQHSARLFLVAYLEKWPDPLCPLAWLLLAQEAYGALHPRQQSKKLSSFQVLLENRVHLPETYRDLQDTRIEALEELLLEKVYYADIWFLWLHDYAQQHPRRYSIWLRLAETSERQKRLEIAEHALQHMVEIQYHHDYIHYQEGEPPPRADYLRSNVERLFAFYKRYNMTEAAVEALRSCYPLLGHLWDTHNLANRKLLALTRPYLAIYAEQEAQPGGMLQENGKHDLSKTSTVPLGPTPVNQRVGIFVDYENIARFVSRNIDIEALGKALENYAVQFGTVVCRWASASPRNLSNLADVRAGLEAAHFRVRYPRRELQFSASKKDLADFALLECLSEAAANERPNVYLIVSGDRDYYERIRSLLDTGHIVRVIAITDNAHLSLKYRELERARAQERQNAGYDISDFFIDSLEELLYPLNSLN